MKNEEEKQGQVSTREGQRVEGEIEDTRWVWKVLGN